MMPNPGRGRRRWSLAAVMLVLAVPGPWLRPAAADEPLDLATVLELAASGSSTATLVATDLGAAEADVRRAQAGWWPSVDLQAQYLLRDNPIEAQAGTFRFPTAEKSSGQYELSARELIFDGGRRGLAVEAARRQADAVRSSGEADLQRTQLDAMDGYLSALELAGQNRVLEQRLAALRAHQQVVSDLFDHGLVARNDVLETQVRVREVEDQIHAVANRREIAARDLNRRLGRDPGQTLALPDSLPAPPPLPADRDSLLVAAARDNAAVRAAADRVTASRVATDLAQRAWIPSVFVGASHAYQENQYLVHQFMNSVSAGVSWNIFDGGARTANVQQSQARLTAAERQHVELQRTVTVAADAAWLAWDQARREEATARTNVAAASENLRIVEDQYRGGVARSSDVLQAEALLAASRFDVVMRHYATYRAQAGLLVAAGRDLVAFYGGAAGAQER